MTQVDEEHHNNNINNCSFCENEIFYYKVRDHCHLTGNYKGPAHEKCNINVKQKYSNFIAFAFQNFSNYDCHLFFKKLIERKPDDVNLNVIPKTNEEYFSVTYGCIRFIDIYRFLSSGLDGFVKTLNEDDFKILKKEFLDNWILLNKELVYPYEYFKSLEDYDLDISNISKEEYFSKLKNGYSDDEEIQRTNIIMQTFNIKNGEELTHLYLKSDVILLADVFEKFIKDSKHEFVINPLYCVSLPGCTKIY